MPVDYFNFQQLQPVSWGSNANMDFGTLTVATSAGANLGIGPNYYGLGSYFGTAGTVDYQQFVPVQQPLQPLTAEYFYQQVQVTTGQINVGWSQDEAEWKKAKARAQELLESVLDDAQKDQLQKEEHFELQVGDRYYRIRPGSRVERLNSKTKKVESYFCIHPSLDHRLPPADVALSQKLWLETNEKEFLRIANETKAA